MSSLSASAPPAPSAGNDDGPTLVRLAGVSKSYGEVEVLKGIDLAIRDGEFVTVLGPSGSGKTTVLRLIGGFAEPTAGRILLDGTDISHLPPYRRPFNTVFQDYALFPHLTVAENVAYGLTIRRLPKAEVRARTAQALERVALPDFGHRYPSELSGGQRQRVALARAIVCAPRLVLLDEPLGALDANLRRQMQGFLKRLQRNLSTTFLFVTHDQEEAITMADRIVVMDHGAIIQVGAPDDVYYRPNSAYVARFFGDNNLIACRMAGRDGAAHRVETVVGPLHACFAGPASGLDTAGWLVVRPEAIQVAPPASIANRLSATVADIRFAGPATELRVAAASGVNGEMLELSVKLPSRAGGLGLSVGDACVIGWAASDCCIVPGAA